MSTSQSAKTKPKLEYKKMFSIVLENFYGNLLYFIFFYAYKIYI